MGVRRRLMQRRTSMPCRGDHSDTIRSSSAGVERKSGRLGRRVALESAVSWCERSIASRVGPGDD